MTTHYVVMRDRFKAWNMTDAATQTAVSLLRFCDVIPPDKAFYLAVRLIAFSYMSRLSHILLAFHFLPRPAPRSHQVFSPFSTGHGLQRRLSMGEHGVRPSQPLPDISEVIEEGTRRPSQQPFCWD